MAEISARLEVHTAKRLRNKNYKNIMVSVFFAEAEGYEDDV